MLPEISQQLLRKAREGQIYLKPTPVANGKDDKGKGGGKDVDGGFVSKKWTLVARDQEAEEPTYLAKRRKGLPPTFGVGIANLNPQTSYRTTRVKKYDAEGKLHVYEVLAPEGQQVEGEIVAEDDTAKAAPVEPVAAAPGTVVEGVGVVNEHGVVVSNDLLLPTPPRRKPPPPRRKPKKGPGRGKKKVIFEGGEAPAADGTTPAGVLNVPGIAAERATDSAAPSSQADTPMPDAGDDEEGSGSEGEEGEDGEDGREEGELSPSPEPEDAAGEKQSVPPSDPLPSAAPAAEVKEEQKEEAMAIDSATHEIAEQQVPALSDVGSAPEPSALPGLTQALTSPSLPAQPNEPESTSANPPDPQAPAIPSSPEIPLAAGATSETPQVPVLPTPVPTDAPMAAVEESISAEDAPRSEAQNVDPAPDAAMKSIEEPAAKQDVAMKKSDAAGEEVDLVAVPTTASMETTEPKAEEAA
jgi:hypothetical protein